MNEITFEDAFKAILPLCTIIGILIGVIWGFLRKEICEIKKTLEKLNARDIEVLLNYVTKKECEKNREEKR